MKKKFYFFYCIASLLIYMGCSSKYSKENHITTFRLSDSLYMEKYKVFSGGATTSDSYSYYLTDSVHFRKHIGTEYHSNDQILWNIRNYSEVIFYMKTSDLEEGAVKIINYIERTEKDPAKALEKMNAIKFVQDTTEIGRYDVHELIREGKFE